MVANFIQTHFKIPEVINKWKPKLKVAEKLSWTLKIGGCKMNFSGSRLNIIILAVVTAFWYGATEEISSATNTSNSGEHHHHNDYPYNYDDYQDTDYPSTDDYGNNRGRSLMDHDNEDYPDSNDEEYFLKQLESTIPGVPGVDYPLYQSLPETSFSCENQRNPGFYGDVEAQCQVFHICQEDSRQNSFLCPLGTVFNQMNFVCDWWFNFKCTDTPKFYHLNSQMSEISGTTPASVQMRKAIKNMRRFRKASKNMAEMMKIVDDLQNSGMDKMHRQGIAEKMMRAIMKKRVKNLFEPRKRSEKIWKRAKKIQDDESEENTNIPSTMTSLSLNVNELEHKATTSMHDYLKLEPVHDSNRTDSFTIIPDSEKAAFKQDEDQVVSNVSSTSHQYLNPTTNNAESSVEYFTGITDTDVSTPALAPNKSRPHFDNMNSIATVELETPTSFSDATPLSVISPKVTRDSFDHDKHSSLFATFTPNNPVMNSKSESIEKHTETNNRTLLDYEMHNNVNKTDTKTDKTEEIPKPKVVFSYNSTTNHEPLLSLVNDTHISVSVTIRATAGLSRLKWKRIPDSRKMRKYFEVPLKNEDNLAAMDLNFRKRNMKPKSRIMWIPVKNNTLKMKNYWGMYIRPREEKAEEATKTVTPTEKIEMLSLLRAEFLKSDNNMNNTTDAMSLETSSPLHENEYESVSNAAEIETSSAALETSESSIKNATEYIIYNVDFISGPPSQDITSIKHDESSTETTESKQSCKSGCSIIFKRLNPKQILTSTQPTDRLIENRALSRKSQTVFGRRSFLGASPSEQLTVKYDPRLDCDEDEDDNKKSFRGWSVIIDTGLVTKEKTVKRRKCRDDVTSNKMKKTMPWTHTRPTNKISKKNENKNSQNQQLRFGSMDQQYWLNLVKNWLDASPDSQRSHNARNTPDKRGGDLNHNSHSDTPEDWSRKLEAADGRNNRLYNSQEIHTRGRANKDQDDSFHSKWSSQNADNLPRNNRLRNEDIISKNPSRNKHHSDDLQIYQSNRNEWLIDVPGDNSDFKLPSSSNLMTNNDQSSFAFRTHQQKNKLRNENGAPVQNNGWLYDGGSKNKNAPPTGDSDWASRRADSKQPSRDASGFNQPNRFSFDSDESRSSFPRNDNSKRPSSPDKSQNWSPENGKEDRYWASSNQHFQTAENGMDGWQTEAQNPRNDWSRNRRDMNNWPNEENQDQNAKSNKNSGAVRPPTYQLNEEILAALTANNFMDSGASWGDKNPQSSGPQNDEQVWLNDESDWAQEENMMKETWPDLTGTMDDWSTDTQSAQKPSDKQNRNQDWSTSSADKGSWSDFKQNKMTGDRGLKENGRSSRANDWSLDMQRDVSNDDSRTSGKMSDFNWSSSSRNHRNKKGDSRNQSQWPQETIQETPDWSSSFNDDRSKQPKQNVDKGRSRLPLPSSQPASNNKGRSFNIPNQQQWNIDSGFDMKSDMSSDWSQNNKRTTIKSSGKSWTEDSPTLGSSWKDEGDSRSGRKVDSNINLAWDSDESWDTDSKPRSGSDAWDSSTMNDWSLDGKAKSDWSSGNTPSFNNDGVKTGRQNPSNRGNNKGSSFPNSSNKGSKIPDRDWSTNTQKSEDDPWPNDGPPKGQIFPKGNSRPMKGSDTPGNKSPGRDWSTDTQKSEDDPWANDNPTRGQTSPKKNNRPMKGSGKPRNQSPDRDWSTDTQKSEDDSWQNDGPPKGQILPKKNNRPMKGSDIPRNISPDRDWSTDAQKTEDDSWATSGATKGQASSMKSKQPMKGSATPRQSSAGDWSSDEDSDWSSDKSLGVSWSDQTPERRSWAQDKPKDPMPSSKGTLNIKGRTKNKPGNGKSPPSVPWSGVKGKNNATNTKGDSAKMDEEIVWSIQISSNGKPGNGWVPITLRPNLTTRTNESSSPQNSKGSSWNGNGKTKKQTDSWDTDRVLKVTQGPLLLNAGIVTENSFPSAEITEASQVQRFYISNARRRLRRDDKKGANNRHGIGRVREIPKSVEHEYEEMKDENNRFFLASADILVGEEYITKHGSKKHRIQNIRNSNNTPSKLKKDFLTSHKENSSSDMNIFRNIAKNSSKSLLDVMQESNVREIWSEPFDASSIPKSGWIPLLSASNFKVNATPMPYLNSNLNNSKFTSFSNEKSDNYENNFEGNKETVSSDSSKEADVASNSGRGARNFKNSTDADIYDEEETISFFDEEMRVGNETIRVIPFSNIMKQIRADSKVLTDDATSKAEDSNSGNSEWNLPMTAQPKTYSLKQIDASEMLTGNKSSAWMFAKQTEKMGDAWILVEEKKQPSETILQDLPDNSSITDDSNSTQNRNSKPDSRKQDYVYKIIVGNRTDERVDLRRVDEEEAEKINIHPKNNHTDKFSFNFKNGQQDSDWTPLLRSVGSVSSRTNISSVNRRKIE